MSCRTFELESKRHSESGGVIMILVKMSMVVFQHLSFLSRQHIWSLQTGAAYLSGSGYEAKKKSCRL